MTKVLTIHSFRGGTGKSNITANLAALLAVDGARVGVVDTDIQSPGIQVLFGIGPPDAPVTLNDYLWGTCEITQAALDMTTRLGAPATGRLYLVPSSLDTGGISRVLRQGYDVNVLKDGFRTLIQALKLDYLLIDTHPGLNTETLHSIAMSSLLLIMLRPDQQDYLGTGITVQVARKLGVPEILLVVNKVPRAFDPATVRARVAAAYGCEVAAVLPHADEMMILASEGLFALRHPTHPLTTGLKSVVGRIRT